MLFLSVQVIISILYCIIRVVCFITKTIKLSLCWVLQRDTQNVDSEAFQTRQEPVVR